LVHDNRHFVTATGAANKTIENMGVTANNLASRKPYIAAET
jgi:flagellar basal body rod protein FlgF